MYLIWSHKPDLDFSCCVSLELHLSGIIMMTPVTNSFRGAIWFSIWLEGIFIIMEKERKKERKIAHLSIIILDMLSEDRTIDLAWDTELHGKAGKGRKSRSETRAYFGCSKCNNKHNYSPSPLPMIAWLPGIKQFIGSSSWPMIAYLTIYIATALSCSGCHRASWNGQIVFYAATAVYCNLQLAYLPRLLLTS